MSANRADRELPLGVIGRREEWKSLDMVPVKMREDQEAGTLYAGVRIGCHFLAQLTDASTGIQDTGSHRPFDENTGRIAAEFSKVS